MKRCVRPLNVAMVMRAPSIVVYLAFVILIRLNAMMEIPVLEKWGKTFAILRQAYVSFLSGGIAMMEMSAHMTSVTVLGDAVTQATVDSVMTVTAVLRRINVKKGCVRGRL